MGPWWWVLIGLAGWLGLSLAVGLWLGPVLRRSSQTREALDAQIGEKPAGREGPPPDGHPPQDGPSPQEGHPPEDGPMRLEICERGRRGTFGGVLRRAACLSAGLVPATVRAATLVVV